MWQRSGIPAGDTAASTDLKGMLTPVDDAPRKVHDHRRRQGADVSLIWHVDPIEPPDRDPFNPPEIAANGGAPGTVGST
jgi:hypothetical protein